MLFKKIFKKNKKILALLLTIGFLFNTSIGSLFLGVNAGKNVAQAKDSSHAGMVYLQPKLDASSHHIIGSINNAKVGDAFWAQDTEKAPEFLSTKTLYAVNSWKWTANLLNGGNPGDLGEKNLLDSQSSVKKWQDFAESNFSSGKNGNQTNVLVMSFPGWGANDTIDNIDLGKTEVKNRLDSGTPEEFQLINSNNAANAAGAVNEELIQEFNRALDVFYSRVVNKDTNQGNVSLTKEGLANMVWLVAHGYMPKDASAIIKYDTNNYTFDTDNLAKGTFEVVNKMKDPANPKQDINVDPWKIDIAGAPILKFKTPDAGNDNNEDKVFTYGVSKGYAGGVGDGSTSKYATDVYGLTWRDLAINAIATANNPDVKSADATNTTVVGDQVNSLLYSGFSTALSLLGIQKVDDLIFGEAGNLFKNNTYKTYLLIMVPFTALALIFYWYIGVDAFRKSTLSYLNTGEARSVMNSITKVVNGLLMTVIFPLIVFVLVFLDQAFVKFALNLHYYFSMLVGSTDASVGFVSGFLADTLGSIIVAFMLAWIDIKFTWRYIARTISFGLYFITSPLLFAFDAVNNENNGFLQYGSTAGEVWKNIMGVIFQRSIDALGVVFAINIGRLIFGQGILVMILGYLTIEAMTNAILNMFNIRNSTIKGIEEAGRSIFGKATRMGAAFAGGVGAGLLGKGYASMKSGQNLDAENLSQNLQNQSALSNDTSAKNLAALDKEVQNPSGSKIARKLRGVANNVAQATGVNTPLATTAFATGTGTSTGENNFSTSGESSTLGGTAKGAPIQGFDSETSAWDKIKNIGTADKERGVFGQGFFNKGIYGDKDTVGGRTSQLVEGSRLDHNRFQVDENGKITSKSSWLSAGGIKDRATLLGRNATRFGAGVASGITSPRTMGRGLAAGTFAAISQITPGKFDDLVAGAFALANTQDALTGKTSGAMSTLSSTLMGRALGMKRSNFEVDSFRGGGTGKPQSLMRDSGGGTLGSTIAQKGVDFATLGNGDQIQNYTSFDSEVTGKQEKQALSSAQELTKNLDNSFMNEGMYSMSREQLVEQVYNKDTGFYNESAANLLDYMDANQYTNMSYDGTNLGFKQSLEAVDSFNPQDPGLNAHKKSIVERLEAQGDTESAEVRDNLTNTVYKYNEKGEISQYGNMNKIIDNQNYLANKQLLQSISKDSSLNQRQKGEIIQDVYSGKRADVEKFSQLESYIKDKHINM